MLSQLFLHGMHLPGCIKCVEVAVQLCESSVIRPNILIAGSVWHLAPGDTRCAYKYL